MMVESPKVDVIIPVFNGEKTIAQAIKSVLNQPIGLIGKIIVIDDGSTDRTRELVASINSPHIQMVTKPNSGVALARNQGLELSTSEWVAFLDSDDVWSADKLNIQMECAEKFKVGFICCNSSLAAVRAQSMITCLSLWKGNFIATSSVMVKRAIAQKLHPLFAPQMRFGEDYLAWYKILSIENGYYINQPLVNYFISPSPHYRIISVGVHLISILKNGLIYTITANESSGIKLLNIASLLSGVLFSIASIVKRFIKSYF